MARDRFLVLVLVFYGGLLLVQSVSDDDFAEFEDDSEFDFEVDEEEDDNYNGDEVEGAYGEENGDFDDVDGSIDDDFETDLDEEEFEHQPAAGRRREDIKLSDSAKKMGPAWKNYILEMIVVSGMVVYLVNYFIGRSKNSSLAYSWLKANSYILNFNFAVVGDSGEGEDPTEGELVKECDDVYTLWCSGRHNCWGMLVHMQFCRRHDLMAVFLGLIQKRRDRISIVFQFHDEVDEMDSFVLAIGSKKILQRMQKDYEDLNNYCLNPPRPVNKVDGLFQLSELSEATQNFLSERNRTFFTKYGDMIECIHISDQYTGYVQDSDDSETVIVRKPEKRIKLNFYVSKFNEEGPYLRFALQVLDQVRNIRLSRESRDKAMKNRISVSTSLDKMQHSQRQEAAQQRKEDKIRARKEKNMLLSESDPEKARKLEEKENKRARKKMQPKIKSMKM